MNKITRSFADSWFLPHEGGYLVRNLRDGMRLVSAEERDLLVARFTKASGWRMYLVLFASVFAYLAISMSFSLPKSFDSWSSWLVIAAWLIYFLWIYCAPRRFVRGRAVVRTNTIVEDHRAQVAEAQARMARMIPWRMIVVWGVILAVAISAMANTGPGDWVFWVAMFIAVLAGIALLRGVVFKVRALRR